MQKYNTKYWYAKLHQGGNVSGHGQTSKADKSNSVSDESFLIRGSNTNQSKNKKGTKIYFIRFFEESISFKVSRES